MTFSPDSSFVAGVHLAENREPRRGGARPSLLILHYTGMSSAAKAIDWLACAESGVSCHYVIAEDGRITQLVPEALRAWHAGASHWRSETDINSHSIGIEIQNPGHQHGYPDFPPSQMQAVVSLAKDIVSRHRMAADGVLAHSDVAPGRKIDPGEKFNWALLAKEGLGLWVRPAPVRSTNPASAPARAAGASPVCSNAWLTTVTASSPPACSIKRPKRFSRHFNRISANAASTAGWTGRPN